MEKYDSLGARQEETEVTTQIIGEDYSGVALYDYQANDIYNLDGIVFLKNDIDRFIRSLDLESAIYLLENIQEAAILNSAAIERGLNNGGK